MKKTIFLLFAILFLIAKAYSQNITDLKTATDVARLFYYERVQPIEKTAFESIKLSDYHAIYNDTLLLYYVFEVENGGFIVVSGYTGVVPVLAYSFESSYQSENLPDNFKSWMGHYTEQIKYAAMQNLPPEADIVNEWQRLSSNDKSQSKYFSKEKTVLPLISSRWNQGKFYNGMCPLDEDGPGERVVAGCVATAMGQLMYYHRWPLTGTGSYAYNHDTYGVISADFGNTTYEWDAMANTLQKPNKAVAKLLFHMGVAVDMNYGPFGSGMWNHSAARSMRNYFKYGPETEYIFRDSTTLAWDSILIANIDNKKPLYYAGWTQNPLDSSGHAFICDGYQGSDYFHFDWGWGGAFNGYFYLHNLTPGGANFNYRQEVIKDIYPDTINYNYPVYCNGPKWLTGTVGYIEDGSGINTYAPNIYCSWLIAPEHEINSITLSFDLFDTAENIDFVNVYDGATTTDPLLGSFSGQSLPHDVTSTGDTMLITFSTSDSTSGYGFRATYSSALNVYCSPMTVISNTSGILSDGSGQFPYNHYTNCTWRIHPPNAEYITIDFSYLDTDTLDYLEILDFGNPPISVLDKYSGNTTPPVKTYKTSALMIRFRTNTFNPGLGWEFEYSSSATSIDEITNDPSVKLYPNPAKDQFLIYTHNTTINDITIFSIDGQQIKNIKTPPSKSLYVNTQKWTPGVYIVHIQTDKIIEIKRLVIY